MRKVLPGLGLAVLLMLLSLPLASGLGRGVSAVPIGIILGLLLRNLVALPPLLDAGIKFSTSFVLRLGIVLVGLKLSLTDLFGLGLSGIPVVLVAVATGLAVIPWLNAWLGLPPRLGLLLAAGTSICGITAIASTAPVIEADEREVAYAVANVTLFGLLGMLIYPYAVHALAVSSQHAGLVLGTAIHDTSQVVGAAITYQEVFHDAHVLNAATVTKLTRNLCLAFVIPFIAWRWFGGFSQHGPKPSFKTLVPPFILGFLAAVVVRTTGDAVWGVDALKAVWYTLGETWGARYLLGTALAAVGLSTSFSVFKGVGMKPFMVGLCGALLVGGAAFVTAWLMTFAG